MNCPICQSHIDPKLDVGSLFTAIALTALLFFIGGLFFYHGLLIPKYEQKIEKDGEIKKELRDNYVPSRPEPKKKG